MTRTIAALLGALFLGVSLTTDPAAARPHSQRRSRASSWRGVSRPLQVPIYRDEMRLSNDALWFRHQGRTVLPMRAIATSLGSTVMWDAKTRTVYAWQPDGTGVRFRVGERTARQLRLDGAPSIENPGAVTGMIRLEVPTIVVRDVLYIPLRAAIETLQARVDWDRRGRAVRISRS
jgi:hypothetical protein